MPIVFVARKIILSLEIQPAITDAGIYFGGGRMATKKTVEKSTDEVPATVVKAEKVAKAKAPAKKASGIPVVDVEVTKGKGSRAGQSVRGNRYKVGEHSCTEVIRWCGKHGMDFIATRSAFDNLSIPCADSTIRIQLLKGRKDEYVPRLPSELTEKIKAASKIAA